MGCSAAKLKHSAPARKFYTLGLFRASHDYAEKTCEAVRIASAFCGIVTPNSVIHPRDPSARPARHPISQNQIVAAFQ